MSIELGSDYAIALVDVSEDDGACTFAMTWCGTPEGQHVVVPLADVEEWIWRVSQRAGINLRAMVSTRSAASKVEEVES